ncbi:hypothetical protein ACFVS5_14070 [Streptomyces albidoflavus]|uniref:hypothetical protein n=1 Tax=Streptomyces TaxID=1883 RepID=UPI000362AE0E|nr:MULTISPECIES: hypothetical protein [Streptomyces]QHC17210.1 hypothetical protein GR131_18145 [Streptomyces sp. GF20]RZD63109.1 hypothetical protein C0Q59_11670 [Streptomyces albidoflavus]RZF07772.1 hypothetical protein C0R05_13135 [Streptomyces albidoflavus]
MSPEPLKMLWLVVGLLFACLVGLFAIVAKIIFDPRSTAWARVTTGAGAWVVAMGLVISLAALFVP